MKFTMEWTWSCTTSKPEDSHNPMLDEQNTHTQTDTHTHTQNACNVSRETTMIGQNN